MAGVEGFGVLSAILTRVKRNPTKVNAKKLQNSTLEEFVKEKVELEVGGLDSNRDDIDGEHFHYLRDSLKPGDEILIRILPPGDHDEPKRE